MNPEWISAISAALALLGALISWWRANLSKQARTDAEAARTDAQLARDTASRHLQAVREQVSEMQRIAKALEGPPLETERVNRSVWLLRNRTSATVEIAELINRETVPAYEFDTPVELAPDGACEIMMMATGGMPLPPSLVLRVTGRPDPIHVPIARN